MFCHSSPSSSFWPRSSSAHFPRTRSLPPFFPTERQDRDLERGHRSLEDDPGTFATMLETTLDFFFLTPVLFTKKDGTPMFTPRARDRLKMAIASRPISDEEKSRPTLSFLPDRESTNLALKYVAQAAAAFTAENPTPRDASSRALIAQPRPEESTDPVLRDLVRPPIPAGHRHIPRDKYTYDEGYKLCPVMQGGLPRGPPNCLVRLPGIFVDMPVYGLPRLVAGNLIHCLKRLYNMFGVHLPPGLAWGEMVLRMDGASTPLGMTDEVLPEAEDDGKSSSSVFAAAAAAAGIDFGAASTPLLHLEARDATIHCTVRGAPRPMAIRSQVVEGPVSTILEDLNDKEARKGVPDAAQVKKDLRAREQRRRMKAPLGSAGSAAGAAARDDLEAGADGNGGDEEEEEEEEEEEGAEELAALSGGLAAMRSRGGRPGTAAGGGEAKAAAGAVGKGGKSKGGKKSGSDDEGEEDNAEEQTALFARLAAQARKQAVPTWREELKAYDPQPYNAKVKVRFSCVGRGEWGRRGERRCLGFVCLQREILAHIPFLPVLLTLIILPALRIPSSFVSWRTLT